MAKPIIVVNIVHRWLALTKEFLCETTSFFAIGWRQLICNTWCTLEIKQNFTSKNLWEKWSKWFLRLISTLVYNGGICLGWKWWQTVLERENPCILRRLSISNDGPSFFSFGGSVGGREILVFSPCSQDVPKRFPSSRKHSPRCSQWHLGLIPFGLPKVQLLYI
jgi:hypothetical protein